MLSIPLQYVNESKTKITANITDYYAVSDRATAVIALCVLKDFGLNTDSHFSHVWIRNKERRRKG